MVEVKRRESGYFRQDPKRQRPVQVVMNVVDHPVQPGNVFLTGVFRGHIPSVDRPRIIIIVKELWKWIWRIY